MIIFIFLIKKSIQIDEIDDQIELKNYKNSEINILKEDNINKSNVKFAKFNIIEISSYLISPQGGDLLKIIIDQTLTGMIFCKFGDRIISAKKIENNIIFCRTPPLLSGLINFSISIDKIKWCNSITLTVLEEDINSNRFKLGIIIFVFLILLITFSRLLWVKGSRKRKLEQVRNKKFTPLLNQNIIDSNYKRKGNLVV